MNLRQSFTAFCGFAILVSSLGSTVCAEESVADRIKPVGSSCMEGQPCAAAVVAAVSGPRTGEQVYTAKCSMCHASGLLNAPKLGDASAWGPRLAERKLEGLYAHALTGFNSMPPKGTCADCTDDEVKAAVKYMVDKAK